MAACPHLVKCSRSSRRSAQADDDFVLSAVHFNQTFVVGEVLLTSMYVDRFFPSSLQQVALQAALDARAP
jgi:hypothetical protein